MDEVDIIQTYKQDPVGFMVDVLDVEKEHVWDKMQEVIESVRDNQKTAVKAGHSVSKTYLAARMALWYLYCFYPCTVVTTATTYTQVEQILWRDIRLSHAQAKIPLGGKPTTTKLELSEKWFSIGVSVRPDTVTQQATAIQGYHNENVLIIIDEAAGVHKVIWDAIDSLIINERCKVLAIGNPTASKGEFVNCFKNPDFKKLTISVCDTPNFKEDKEIIPGVSGRKFYNDTARKYGKHSNYFKSRVLGEIPDDNIDQLIPTTAVEKAEKRNIVYKHSRIKRYIVVDPADGGQDPAELCSFTNLKMTGRKTLREMKVEQLVTPIMVFLRETDSNCIIVDIDGIGRVLYKLLEAVIDSDIQIIGFEGSSTKTMDSNVFKHRYSEGHWAMREAFLNNKIDIIPREEQKEELTTVKIDNEDISKYIVIRKKKYDKEELGRSPGLKDTIMMACAEYDNVNYIDETDDTFYSHSQRNWRTA